MINSVNDLEFVEDEKMKDLCTHIDPDDIAVTLHAVSPLLIKKFKKAMSASLKRRVHHSPYRKQSVPLDLVKKSHQKIVDEYNKHMR